MKKLSNMLVALGMAILISMLSISPVYAIDFHLKGEDGLINIVDIDTCQQAGDIAFNKLNDILAYDMQATRSQYNRVRDNYAGSIIDDEGKLIVYISSELSILDPLRDELSSTGVNDDDIKFVQVQYSYEDLEVQQSDMWRIRNVAMESKSNLGEWARKIISVAINPEHNCISVLVNNFGDSDYLLCERHFRDYSYEVEITTASGEIHEEVTLKPGQGISTGGSLGFRCELNGIAGFVTAVHTASWSTLPKLVDGSTEYGQITAGVYDGKADFCYVEITNSNYAVSLTTNTSPSYTLHASHYVVSLPTNYTVYMAGTNSSSVRTGKVLYYNYAISSGTEWLLCDYSSAGGDSGGCIFANVNGDYVIVGIHDGTTGTGKYGTKLTTMKGYYSNLVIY